ncbi:MAG TPA: pectate lyase [Arcobacter sp.]|nr:pectate lyase [Arcobacter sp.]
MQKIIWSFLLFILLGLYFKNINENQKLLAFPSAEGSGALTVGGRGGKVIEVTNLDPEGIGSFRAACESKGKRTVVFKVGGTIDLEGKDIVIKNDYLTIAGQTALGDGIQIKNGGLRIMANEVIVRYLRIRPGPAYPSATALDIASPNRHNRKKNIIVDHVSAFWGVDETLNAGSFSDNVTIQWCIIAEGLHCSIYDGGKRGESWKPCKTIKSRKIWAHSRGSMVSEDSRNITYHHNLFFNNFKRNPLVQSSDIHAVNNVMVNYQYQVYIQPFKSNVRANFIGNYFRSHIHNRPPIRVYDFNNGYDGNSSIYYKDNYDSHFRADNSKPETSIRVLHFSKVDDKDGHVRDKKIPHSFSSVGIESVHDAYKNVLLGVGAVYPKRDSTDKRVIDFVKNGGSPKKFVNEPSDVGGWPTLKGGKSLLDSDYDGMPDSWEIEHNLNMNNPNDRNGKTLSSIGYTNLEVYLNSLINSHKLD